MAGTKPRHVKTRGGYEGYVYQPPQSGSIWDDDTVDALPSHVFWADPKELAAYDALLARLARDLLRRIEPTDDSLWGV